ncbi:MAG: hypothetical protein EOP22_01630 [Hyphomicrobiales bacterium]|nr:MAG: hypothetical protein EOP22_01630 [Hyphomicrobiales bacterium]
MRQALIALIALMAIGGPGYAAGDFGRAERNFLNTEILPRIGAARAANAGEPVSAFNLADQEVEMRDRVWRYLVAPQAYDWFGDIAVELQRARVIAASNKPLRVDLYYRWLHETRFASSRVRYSRIREDAIADIGMMPSAFRSICAVLEMDRQRGLAYNEIAELEEEVGRNAAARQAENLAVINWFVRAVGNRYASYSYALDHLLVETPHEEAIVANASLTDLAVYVEAAERGDFCLGNSSGHDGQVAIRSRYVRSAPDEGPYRK